MGKKAKLAKLAKLAKTATPTSAKKSWWQSIKDNLYAGYNGILDTLKSPFIGLSKYLNKSNNPDKFNIDALREKQFALIKQEAAKGNPNYMDVSKAITEDNKKYIQNLISEETKKLGKPPCDFTVVTLGSMARKESGPVTDLEIGFIIKEKNVENYKYFYQLSQNLSDRLFLLGEHPDIGGKGLRMDEADNAPPHLRFFARNATNEQAQKLLQDAIKNKQWDKIPFEGSRPFLATAEEFASYSKDNFEQDKFKLHKARKEQYNIELAKATSDPKNKDKLKSKEGKAEIEKEVQFWVNQIYRPFSNKELNIANDAGKKLGRNMDKLYGSDKLYNKFSNMRQKNFDQIQNNGLSVRQNIAQSKLIADISDIMRKEKSIYVTGKLGKTLDMKRELYRFAEQFVTNLGFYNKCKNQNTNDIIKELEQRKILSPDLAAKLSDYSQFATGLRLKEQSVLKRQGFAAYIDQEEFDEDKTKLETEVKLLEDSIEYLESTKCDVAQIEVKKRELFKLKNKHEHLLDMAPSSIYTPEDIKLLKDKYAPMAKEIFETAKTWTQGKLKLGFDIDPILDKKPSLLFKHKPNLKPKLKPKLGTTPSVKLDDTPQQMVINNLRKRGIL